MAKGQDDGAAKAIGWLVVFVIMLVALVPKEVWIFLGVVVGLALLGGAIAKIVSSAQKHRVAAEEQARVQKAAQVAAEKLERAERARQQKRRRIETLGEKNAALVESVGATVKQLAAS